MPWVVSLQDSDAVLIEHSNFPSIPFVSPTMLKSLHGNPNARMSMGAKRDVEVLNIAMIDGVRRFRTDVFGVGQTTVFIVIRCPLMHDAVDVFAIIKLSHHRSKGHSPGTEKSSPSLYFMLLKVNADGIRTSC